MIYQEGLIMKNKIVPIFLCTALVCYNMPAFADDSEFNASEAFKNYASYDDSQINESWKHYYIVSKSNDDNSKALFSEDKQLTDFMYDSIDINNCGIVVSQKRDNTEYFGLIDDENYKELLPIKYRSIENYEATGYIAENTDGSKEYYIVKTPIDEVLDNVDHEETDKLYILNSYEDLKKALGSSEVEPELTLIEGIDNCYIMADSSGFYVNIVNDKGEKLTETNFRSVEHQAGKYDTIIVHYAEGMTDSSLGLLSKDCKTIVPQNFYSSINFITVNNTVYVEAVSYIDNSSDYYDLNGNKVDKPDANTISSDALYSQWAEESIKNSIELGLVPENLQSDYTAKITRREFCQLAVQTYVAKTGNEIDMSVKTPFTDVDDTYITTAYNLKIVSGVGNNKFAPDNYITRQEAAVMLNNLAKVLNIDNSIPQSEKFVDEDYFADWARSAIYSVAGIKSGDTYVMTGTGNGKFSPWMNYTREQAIATMWRLYNAEISSKDESNENLLTNTDIQMPEYDEMEYIGCDLYKFALNGKSGVFNKNGEIIVPAEYDGGSRYAVNDIFTMYNGDMYYIFNSKGDLLKTVEYKLPEGGKYRYGVSSISGSNLVITEHLGDMVTEIIPEQKWFIKRLMSGVVTAEDYYSIGSVPNGEFTALNKEGKYCVLNLDGTLKFETDYTVDKDCLWYLTDGLYMSNYHSSDDVDIIDENGNILIEDVYGESIKVDEDNRVIYAKKDGNDVEVFY